MNKYKDKKVLIFGLGLNQGGVGAAKFFAQQGAEVRVTDLKSAEILQPSIDQLKDFPDITYSFGEHKYEDIDWAELIIKNPIVKMDNPYIKYALEKDKQVELDIGIFLEFVNPKQVIGVTGTKGKSTTANLIYEALNASGRKVVFAGNIGKSVLDTIPLINENTSVVLELSSFQLEAWAKHKISPHIAVITNIYPDHLNYYPDMSSYIASKKLIAQNQTPSDFLFLRKDDPVTTNQEFLSEIDSKITYFSKEDLPKDFNPKLIGEHNLDNFAAALTVSHTLGLNQDATLKAFMEFSGVEFRMQLIKESEGIKIYNDTAATSPDAAIAALKAFPNCILIAGGMNKNLEYEGFAKAIDNYAKSVYFIEGDATEEIKKNIKNKEKIVGTYHNIVYVVHNVMQKAKPGDVILFSPGATSFNFWQNEFDRGRKFNEAVEKIFK